jgi:hypothetical protein
MKHHLKRAKRVYEDRGFADLISSAVSYLPIEFNNAIFRLRHGQGTRVMDEDWDTLILLDACRYDMFAERVPFDGDLQSRISLGSTSEEFLRQNFEDGSYHDTVYVNANVYFPKVGLNQDGTFHAVIDLLEEWDDDLEIVHPRTVTDAAKDAHDTYSNKRIIVHYMQPHIPFIGELGQKIQTEIGYRNAWIPFRQNEDPISIQRLWKGYKENLDLVFEHVSELLDHIEGRVAISADHGNMVGDRQGPIPTKRMYGHPWGVYSDELVNVPWFVIPSNKRRSISAESPQAGEQYSDELITDRLRSLGYRE